MSNEVRDRETYAIIGAAMQVHTFLGLGFLEEVYRQALIVEFSRRDIPFRCEASLPIDYRGQILPCGYRVDFICFDNVLVELKALQALTNIEDAQVMNYLKASKLRCALLINFGAMSLQHKRFVM